MPRTIEVVDYAPEWRAAFEEEAADLAKVFGSHLLHIHHIGSTAIPGLKAKPIVDVLVIIDDISTIDSFSAGMEKLGYRVRGECLDATIPGTPGRFYFSKDTRGVRTHHVHVCEVGHAETEDKLAFRDYLRAHPSAATEYGALKERLAATHHHDGIGYMRGKDPFMKATLIAARRWIGSALVE
jgi:GrpB-like predicted nucleotidyltransferase (UPF0157 family)